VVHAVDAEHRADPLVFEGDTIYSQSEVLEARSSKSRPNVAIVVPGPHAS